MSSVEERNEVAIVAIRGIGSSSAYRPPERVEAAFCDLRLYGVLRSSPERLSCVQSAPCPSGPGLCRILQANFAEFPFRDCPKRVCWVVSRYSSTHEKDIPNRHLRRRVGVHRASPAYSKGCREAQDSLLARDLRRHLLHRA